MDKAALDDLRARVLRGEDVPNSELLAAMKAMCSRSPEPSGKSASPAVPAFDALAFLKAKKANVPTGEAPT